MGSCSDLVTRGELEALKASLNGKYIPQTEKAGIINTSVSISGQLIQAGLAGVGLKVSQALNAATVAQQTASTAVSVAQGVGGQVASLGAKVGVATATAQGANAAALTASRAASKAGFDALYASSRASSAASAAAAARGIGMKALGLVGSVFSIIGTLATAIALAILTVQVANLSKRVTANEQLSRSNAEKIAANEKITKENTRVNQEQAGQIRENREAVAAANAEIELLKSHSVAQDNAIQKINNEIAALKTKDSILENGLGRTTGVAELALQQALLALNKIPVPPPPTDLSNVYAQIDGLQRQLELLKSDNNGLRVALQGALSKVEQKEDKYIVRRVEQATITNASGIRDINGNLIGLDSKIGTRVSELSTNLAKTFDTKITNDVKTVIDKQGLNKTGVEKIVDDKLKDVNKMNEQQASQINSKLDSLNNKVPSLITPTNIALTVGALDIFRQILSKPTGGGGTCFAPQLVPPVAAQTRTNFAAIGTLQGVTITQAGFIQKSVNAVATTTKATLVVVKHGTYGLEAMQRFAKTAWEATHADKILNGITTALVIHNAAMLSKDLTVTVGIHNFFLQKNNHNSPYQP